MALAGLGAQALQRALLFETSVSIAAELISLRWGGSATRLADAQGPIHGANPLAEPEPAKA